MGGYEEATMDDSHFGLLYWNRDVAAVKMK